MKISISVLFMLKCEKKQKKISLMVWPPVGRFFRKVCIPIFCFDVSIT